MLLCEGCNSGWHLHCLQPVLPGVPPGDFYCEHCYCPHAEASHSWAIALETGAVLCPAENPGDFTKLERLCLGDLPAEDHPVASQYY